ncbi:MAG: response regulator, partial [Bacteroidales bacterium]|nr:response regulator [Bacteroidales bacterium]
MAKILIIDDERPIRNTLKDILSYEDHEVDLAQDGFEGLDKINNGKYDIVLCDIKMPKMDGLEVLEKIMEKNREI